jgi:hypothetical protein
LPGIVQALLHRGDRHLEKEGDLLLGMAPEVEKSGHQPQALGQRADRCLHLLFHLAPLGPLHRPFVVGRHSGHRFERRQRHAPPDDPVAVLEHDPPEPARKRLRRAQLRQQPVRIDKRLLGRVLGQVEVTEHGVGVPARHALETSHQLRERRHVSRSGPDDQRPHLFHFFADPVSEGLLLYRPTSPGRGYRTGSAIPS